MVFGVIADGTESIRHILQFNREAFIEQLDRFVAPSRWACESPGMSRTFSSR